MFLPGGVFTYPYPLIHNDSCSFCNSYTQIYTKSNPSPPPQLLHSTQPSQPLLAFRILTEELKRTSEMRHGEMDSSDWAAFLEEQTQRCLTLQLLMPGHSNQLRVEVDGDTHNVKGTIECWT